MKLIILDRDGVINEDSDEYIKGPDEWVPLPGSLDAIARLNHAGYSVAVASNQSGLARGYFDIDTLSSMHHKMQDMLQRVGGKVDAIFFCPHAPDDGCECRKPKPGLLRQIGERFQTPLTDVLFVGDTESDIKAARAAGATPVIVRTGKGGATLQAMEKRKQLNGIPAYNNLAAVVDDLLS
jgi:D-glycero-D-manno-heptose 1,7-bisphosphate phosphatase